MAEESNARLALSEYLTALVAELSEVRLTDTDTLTYDLNGVTVELDIAYTLTRPASGRTNVKPQFWVLRSAPEGEERAVPSAKCHMQRLILRLTPRADDVQAGDGGRLPRARLADVGR